MKQTEIMSKNTINIKRDHFFADIIVEPGAAEPTKDRFTHVENHLERMSKARELKMKNNPYKKYTLSSPKISALPDLSASKYVSMQ